MSAAAKNFTFICGPDDFIVNRLGRERFEALALATKADEFSREIISGFAGNVAEVETAVARFREVVQTMPMFGGQRIIWFKDVNFLADSITGRAEGTLLQVAALQELLTQINPAEVAVIVTAAPVDRRRAFAKWSEAQADFTLAGGDSEEAGATLAAIVQAEAHSFGASFASGAIELLLQKVGPNTRLLTEETRKLSTYAGGGATAAVIEEAHVEELTPNFAEGDFFAAADRSFAGDLPGTLVELQRHFFAGGDARPIISAFQNRNRILLQCRVLLDAGDLRAPGPYGFDKAAWARTQAAYAKHFGGDAEKSSYNFFTQNQWYVGKLVSNAKLPPLRRLIDNQQEFVRVFEEIIRRPHEQEAVLRDLAVRCLA